MHFGEQVIAGGGAHRLLVHTCEVQSPLLLQFAFVRDSVIYRGSTVTSSGQAAPLFLGHTGTLAATVTVESPFKGTAVAPRAQLNLQSLNGTGGLHGRVLRQPNHAVAPHDSQFRSIHVHRNLRRWLSVAHQSALAFLLALAGCGGRAVLDGGAPPSDAGSSGDAAKPSLVCSPFSACGGSLLGSWTVVSDCYDALVEGAGCESFDHTAIASAGTYEFSDTGTFNRDLTSTVSYTLIVPDSCSTSSCAALQAGTEAHIAMIGSGTVGCSSTAGGCSCDIVASTNETLSGQYSAVGSTLTLFVDPNTGATMTNDYCVKGNQLTLHESGTGSVTLSRN